MKRYNLFVIKSGMKLKTQIFVYFRTANSPDLYNNSHGTLDAINGMVEYVLQLQHCNMEWSGEPTHAHDALGVEIADSIIEPFFLIFSMNSIYSTFAVHLKHASSYHIFVYMECKNQVVNSFGNQTCFFLFPTGFNRKQSWVLFVFQCEPEQILLVMIINFHSFMEEF